MTDHHRDKSGRPRPADCSQFRFWLARRGCWATVFHVGRAVAYVHLEDGREIANDLFGTGDGHEVRIAAGARR